MLGMTDDDHRDRDGAQPGQLRDAMVHRLVSVGTVKEREWAGVQSARRPAAGFCMKNIGMKLLQKSA